MPNEPKIKNTRKYSVLIAEDEVSNQFLLERILNNAGHIVSIANNGQEALNFISNHTYDICIFDMQMPVMNGIEAVTSYKSENKLSKLPFIMLTANTDKNVIGECEKSGVDMYLAKPITSKSLLQAINQLVCDDIEEINLSENLASSIIDITQLNNYSDKKFLDEFIEIFESSAVKLTADLENSLFDDFETFKEVLHSIKGLSGNIAAHELRDIISSVEDINIEEYKLSSEEYYRKIINELSFVRSELFKFSANFRIK